LNEIAEVYSTIACNVAHGCLHQNCNIYYALHK